MNKLRAKRKSRVLLYRFYKSINVVSMLSLIFYTSMIGVFFVPNSIAEAGAGGAIWTTKNDCGDVSQDVNHYNVGDWVYINGDNFAADTSYDWEIKGKPGGASSDPNQVVASGNETTNGSGSFCFAAYQILAGDQGEYGVDFGGKKDNYRVGDVGLLTIRKEGSKQCVQTSRFEMYIKDPSLSTNPDLQIIHHCLLDDNYCLGFNEEYTTILDPGVYRAGEVHYDQKFNMSITCDAQYTGVVTNNGHEAEVNLQAGQHITCTFTNVEKPGFLLLQTEARDSATNQLVIGACYEIDIIKPTPESSCIPGTYGGIGFCDGGTIGGQVVENPDGKVRLIDADPNCNYRIRMTTVPKGYDSPVSPQLLVSPLTSNTCSYWTTFNLDPLYATINVHKNVLGSGRGDIVDYTHFTSRVAGVDKTFYEGSPSTYTVLAKTTDVKEVNAETNLNFMFEGCTIDTGHATEVITNGIKIKNIQENDMINVTCTNRYRTSCGDGITEDPNEKGESEQCDDGAQNTDIACTPAYGGSCTYCTTSCQEITINGPYCGDGNQDPGEECDDGNQDNTDACLNTCVNAMCNDGYVYAGLEECDDGNTSDNDTCLNNCEFATCGDGFIQTGVEECDDGNNENNDGCSAACLTEYCGDGILQTGEECEVGDTQSCTTVEGYAGIETCNVGSVSAVMSFSVSTRPMCVWNPCETKEFCGDGIKNGLEACDGSGGVTADQTCLSDCTIFDHAKVTVCKQLDYDGNLEGDDKTDIPGWEMYLQKNTGEAVANQLTGKDGCTTFTIIEPGAYRVVEDLPVGYTSLNGEIFWLGSVESGGQYGPNIFVNHKIPVCGNDELEYGEFCEVGDTQACTTAEGYDGTQSCNTPPTRSTAPLCDWNPCVTDQSCGDGVKNGTEACDPNDPTKEGVGEHQTCNPDCTISNPLKTPSISLDKTDTPDPVKAGENITYTLAYAVFDAPVSGLKLVDTLPANTTFVSASNGGTYDNTTNKVTWDLGTVNPGSYTVTLTIKVAGSITNGTLIINTAVLTGGGVEMKTATQKTTINSGPILTIVKSVEKSPVYPGDSVNYIVTIKNNGSDTAFNLRLADTMPAGFTYDDGSDGSWFFGDLAVGEEKNFIYSMTVGLSMAAGTYTNTAQVSADNATAVKDTADLEVAAKPGAVLGAETEGAVEAAEEELPKAGSGVIEYLWWLMGLTTLAFSSLGVKQIVFKKAK